MSLLQNLSYPEYKYVLSLSTEQCELIAKLANLNLPLNEAENPGKLLMQHLDTRGYSVSKYRKFLTTALNTKAITTYYKPESKVAILIANDKYKHLSKLATPSKDCDYLASALSNLGFVCVVIKNTSSCNLKNILKKVISVIPEDSYCLIFYAGHGCELCNTKCILGIDSPTEDITFDHCITENWILREVAKCQLEMCVLIMDMCRVYLDRNKNQQIYKSLHLIEDYVIHNNLISCYSTQSSKAAYEVVQIECSTSIDNDMTYELKTGDTDKILPCSSQYVNALCTRLTENCDISTLLDRVNGDVEESLKKQKPLKLQCGVAKRSLYDPAKGDVETLRVKLQEILEDIQEDCSMF